LKHRCGWQNSHVGESLIKEKQILSPFASFCEQVLFTATAMSTAARCPIALKKRAILAAREAIFAGKINHP
jgi:hypothetical protein